MSVIQSREPLQLPESLRKQLLNFRRQVWSAKTIEAVFLATFVIVLSFLTLFGLDRVWDSPWWARTALFGFCTLGFLSLPFSLYRWVYSTRRLDQLAHLLGRTLPNLGDQLLGVIELVRSDSEQDRSRDLCEAAILQVADESKKRNFVEALPNPRHRFWGMLAALPVAAVVALCLFSPKATSNTWVRLLLPWSNVARYTFAVVSPLPDHLVVAHGEPVQITANLDSASVWKPSRGRIQLGSQPPLEASLVDGRYTFELPPQIEPVSIYLKIGDAIQQVRLEPTLRPELTSVVTDVTLPAYLERPATIHKDVRGGAVTLVKGSKASFAATASRDLLAANVDGQSQPPRGATMISPPANVEGKRTIEFRWEDLYGLAGKEPFQLAINSRDDEAPSLSTEDLPRQKVILDTELLTFKIRAQDDFGVKQIGLQWQGIDDPMIKNPAKGERVLAAGGAEKDDLEVTGTFSAKSLGIEPQPIGVRVYAEDYLPGRPRIYSPTYTFYVLNAEQHAIWLTEQLSKWHRLSLEVRDREMQLFETNKQLRALGSEELDRPETRRKLESQAAAERANGNRLSSLVVSGEDLVKQASRNPEIGVGHLERWAEMLQILKDISGNRMPSVADLLKQASQAQVASANPTGNKGAKAGLSRATGAGQKTEPSTVANKPPTSIPQVADVESSQQPANKDLGTAPKSAPKSPRLTLAQTTVIGPGAKSKPTDPAPEIVDDAVVQQQDLLAEFEKISEELNKVLANLEGSTLVKRLKAASRLQYTIAGRINDQVNDSFGVATNQVAKPQSKKLAEMAEQEAGASQTVSVIMDDMQAYFERRQFMQFKNVLDEMRKQDVIGSLRLLSDDVKKENGVSIAQCEFWSDSLDRWAEDLVDPACNGSCPGSKSRGSLPPSIVLEVLQILEGEVSLREETRVAEQARPALKSQEHQLEANQLSETQKVLSERTQKVILRILELPEAESNFGLELKLLGQVSEVMTEATAILARPETGSPAIAVETEAIELLLKSRRINPKGGGGGGSNPGGGGGGTTTDSALALLGKGLNEKEVREDHGISQATGNTGPGLPEEFRAGLDEYFNRIERKPSGR